jgi:uncharacterized protein involved in exopolysaccharide biosynthesis
MSDRDSRINRPEEVVGDTYLPEEGRTATSIAAIYVLTELASRKRLIGCVTGAAILIGFACSLALPNEYTAMTRIMPPRQTESTTSLLNSMPGVGSLGDVAAGGLSLKDPNAIYIGLLRSRPVADAIIARFNLRLSYHAKDMTAARRLLDDATRLSSEKSGLISISATDRDKSRAAAIANAYPEELRSLSRRISVTEASKRRLFFEEQLKDAKNDLASAESALQIVEQNKGLLHLDAQSGMIIEGLASVRVQIAAKQVELEALRSYSTEHNPDLQLGEQELSALQGEAARMEQHDNASDFSELGIKDVPKEGKDYVRALQDVQYRQAFFDLMLKQYEAARLDEAKEAAVIQVVEPAIEPDRRSSPKRMTIMIVSTVLGLLTGCLLARFLNWAEQELATPEGARALHSLKRAFTREHLRPLSESATD